MTTLTTRLVSITACTVATLSIPLAQADAEPNATLRTGSTIIVQATPGDDATDRCTLAFIVVTADRTPDALTAGHCGPTGAQVYLNRTLIGEITESTAPTALSNGLILGPADTPDWALIDLTKRSDVTVSADGDTVTPRTVGTAHLGDPVCTEGSTSGPACGTVTEVGGNWITTDIERAPGDSGGPLWRSTDGAALGILGHILTPAMGGKAAISQYYGIVPVLQASDTKLAVTDTRD